MFMGFCLTENAEANGGMANLGYPLAWVRLGLGEVKQRRTERHYKDVSSRWPLSRATYIPILWN